MDEAGVRRARRALLGIVAIGAVGAGFWWWSHPSVFDDYNGGFTADPHPVAEAALSMAVTLPQTGDDAGADLRLTGARVHYATNSADAEETFSVCHLGTGEDPVIAVADISELCRDLEPLRDDMEFQLGSRGDYLVLTVTPTKPGKVSVDRVDVSYALGADHLWRRGTEPLGMDVTITAE